MFHGIAAYEGQTSIPYVASSGKSGTATVTGSVNCGDSFGLQQALKDLGYSVTVDGQVGNETFKALRLFAEANGVAYTPSTFPKGDLCGAIAAAWQAKQAPPPPVAPPADAKKGLLSPVFYAAQKTGLMSKLGRQIAPMSQEGGAGGGVTGWWSEQSTGAKVAMGVGALALVGGLLWYALSPGETTKAKANRRRRARKNGCHANCAMTPNYRGASKKRRYARVIREGLPKTCRTKRRKGYPKKRSKYALPECMMYPLRTKKEVRNAASRFGHWKWKYSPTVRAKIAHRIDRAKKRLKIGEYRVVRRRRRAR